ncbi:MAG: ATP-binding protein [Burkholderiales bacterium]|nr:MAG: ATP-binding protein [Burkholderiales bacterium]
MPRPVHALAQQPIRLTTRFVDDTGLGVPAEHAPHVFEPFYKSRSDTAEGTGLGLGPRPDQHGGCRFTLQLTRHEPFE